MRYFSGRIIAFAVILLMMLFTASGAFADEDGWWRLDADVMAGIYSGQIDREGDICCLLNAAYEFPAFGPGTLAWELVPVFSYFGHYDDVNGAGAGFNYRVYHNEDYTGWFAGIGSLVLFHNPTFLGNSSNVNFMPSFAIGHVGQCGWQASLKISHISNADTSSDNAGLNFVGCSIGRRF